MKVLVVNDTTDWYHFGCTGTSLALKNEIAKLGHDVSSFSIIDGNNLNNIPMSVNRAPARNPHK